MSDSYAPPTAEELYDARVSDGGPDDLGCGAETDSWYCTRAADHDGPHVAGWSGVGEGDDLWWYTPDDVRRAHG